jgi:hypothetical protein
VQRDVHRAGDESRGPLVLAAHVEHHRHLVLFAGLRELGEGGGGVAPQLGRAGELGRTARRGAGGRSILGIALGQQFSTYLGWLISWGTPLTLVGDPAGRPPTPRR